METALRALLLGVGGLPAAAINWGSHPQGQAWPGVVLQLVDDLETVTLDGPTGLSSTRVQIDAYAEQYAAAAALARDVRAILNGYRGGVFQGIFVEAQRNEAEEASDDTPFRVSTDYQVVWNRS